MSDWGGPHGASGTFDGRVDSDSSLPVLCPRCGSDTVEFLDTETPRVSVSVSVPLPSSLSASLDGLIDGLVDQIVRGGGAVRMRPGAAGSSAPLSEEVRDGLMEVVVRGGVCLGHGDRQALTAEEVYALEPGDGEAFTVEGMTCSVCHGGFEAGEKVVELACCHGYHKACLLPWLERGRRTCPVCRQEIR